MNNRIKQAARLTSRFADFVIHSGNRYRIHSPFLYAFTDEVLRRDRNIPLFRDIERLRDVCRQSEEIIQKTDYGRDNGKESGATYPVSVRRVARTSLTSPRHARRLYRLVKFLKAGKVLEMGTSLGLTTAYLALAAPGGRIVTLEGCPELSRKAESHFKNLNINNIDLLTGRFEDTLPKALSGLEKADVIYLDGNHHRDSLLEYYGKCLPHTHNETVIVVDDIRRSPGMEEAWEIIRQREEVRISLDLFSSGWLFFRRESSKEHFRLRYI